MGRGQCTTDPHHSLILPPVEVGMRAGPVVEAPPHALQRHEAADEPTLMETTPSQGHPRALAHRPMIWHLQAPVRECRG